MTFNQQRNRWGTGHYFSTDAKVSHSSYTSRTKDTKTLFLALVCLGDTFFAGPEQDYKQPQGPFIINGKIVDSVMGPDLNHRSAINVCVPRDSQVFLLYRIDYMMRL